MLLLPLLLLLLPPALPLSPLVALTRQSPAADRPLADMLPESVPTVNLPCVHFTMHPLDTLFPPPPGAPAALSSPATLSSLLSSGSFTYTVITSAEAARVLLSHLSASGLSPASLPTSFAAVGPATARALEAGGVAVSFVPPLASARSLAETLPHPGEAGPARVLYPCSELADGALPELLAGREPPFAALRCDTYTTGSVRWPDPLAGDAVTVAAFGSPSAVRGWVENTPLRPPAACIGATTRAECLRQGWGEGECYAPGRPGVEGWGEAVREALEKGGGGGE
ncbi:hypothetical protein TeGR_g5419, partial [Tetraparma gracilis]